MAENGLQGLIMRGLRSIDSVTVGEFFKPTFTVMDMLAMIELCDEVKITNFGYVIGVACRSVGGREITLTTLRQLNGDSLASLIKENGVVTIYRRKQMIFSIKGDNYESEN